MDALPASSRASGARDFDLVIFDCDGVLIDSEVIACRIDAEELTRLGFAITAAEVARRFAGRSARETRDAIEAEWGRTLPPSFDAAVSERIADAFRAELRAVAGIDAVLAALDTPACVASSSGPAKLRLGLELTGLWRHFAPNVFSAAMVARGKPAPDLFLLAATRMEAAPSRTVVVEDSVAGVQAAVAAGMRAIGFLGGSHCPPRHGQVLADAGAAQVVRGHAELARLLHTSG